MKLKFWGTRGSIAISGKDFCKYGGNTPCIEISTNDSSTIIFDAGTGIRELGIDLLKRKSIQKIYLFFSHFHTDHIVGLPFFTPLYNDSFEIKIFGKPYVYNTVEEIIDLIIKPPFFSITKDYFRAHAQYHNIDNNFLFENDNFRIETIQLNHPNPTLGFKLTSEDKSAVYFTDNELVQNNHTSQYLKDLITNNHFDLIKFCKNADVLIHDTSYSMDDYDKRVGWGHSNIFSAAMLAHLAEVKNFYLFHYDPTYSDEMIDELLEKTQKFLESLDSQVNCFASADSLEVVI